MGNEIKVSIICNAYNHEKYIEKAIDSFIMQKTDFTYEILIHDDASTDKTAKIIKQYEERYPDIVKPIYQTENQYSKGKDINVKKEFILISFPFGCPVLVIHITSPVFCMRQYCRYREMIHL